LEGKMKIIPSVRGRFLHGLIIGLALSFVSAPALEAQSPEQISSLGQEIYQVNCAVCHGVEGDGNGPAASMFLIRPRDFRTGIYKFRSTPSGSLPTDDDLLRTVTQGLRWTGMIGRADLPENARSAVVQYLKTFSPRFAKEQPGKPVVVPPAPAKTPQLVAQGQKLYGDLGCVACHGQTGQGNGPAAQGLKDDWGWPIWPSDLTWRPLKRGSDLKEIYLTIVTGLSGTPMPSYASALNGQQARALVYYLESLVPPDHRLSPDQLLGEEQRGWMVVRMGGMMGGMMGPGMMGRGMMR
jgi:cytochrome c oxidase cbb3-type subunit I/II